MSEVKNETPNGGLVFSDDVEKKVSKPSYKGESNRFAN
jgi:hypothetical protein